MPARRGRSSSLGSGPEGGPNGSLRSLRLIAGVVLLAIIGLMVIADAVAGQLGPIRPDYHVEPIVFGTVLGGLLLLVGIEIGSRWPWGGGGGIGGGGPEE